MKSKWADCTAPLVCLPLYGETTSRLMEDWRVVVRGHEFIVPKDTRTDGASIPRFLWRVCGHPLEAPRAYAALFHDWAYEVFESMGLSRAEADECYYALLRHFGVGAFRAGIEFYALRLCGGSHYTKKERKNNEN